MWTLHLASSLKDTAQNLFWHDMRWDAKYISVWDFTCILCISCIPCRLPFESHGIENVTLSVRQDVGQKRFSGYRKYFLMLYNPEWDKLICKNKKNKKKTRIISSSSCISKKWLTVPSFLDRTLLSIHTEPLRSCSLFFPTPPSLNTSCEYWISYGALPQNV